jgi:hypothetical protein
MANATLQSECHFSSFWVEKKKKESTTVDCTEGGWGATLVRDLRGRCVKCTISFVIAYRW